MANKHEFTLDKTHAAASRLNLQYYLWKETLKYDIEPSIQKGLSPNSTIADVACGTGIWLLHVARDYPNASFEGFDIDLSRAPTKHSLPSNVKVREWNIFHEVPTDLVGKFDYVHVRLLILVIENRDPSGVIRNLLKLLKPGGRLQWDELNDKDIYVRKDDPAIESFALDQLRTLCCADGRYDWSVRLSDFLTEGGFLDAKTVFYGDDQEIARAFNDQHMLTMDEFALMMGKSGNVDMARWIQGLVSDAFTEATKGATLCIPRLVCTARKGE